MSITRIRVESSDRMDDYESRNVIEVDVDSSQASCGSDIVKGVARSLFALLREERQRNCRESKGEYTRVPNPIDLIVEAIVKDIRDRRGIGHEWDQIDAETRFEIRRVWASLIADILSRKQN